MSPHLLPAKTSTSIPLLASQTLKITTPHGSQPISLWALPPSNPSAYLSMAHTHAILRKLSPSVNDNLYSCLSQPLLTFTEDTSSGTHDTLIAACNAMRYTQLGVQGWHASCEENYRLAVEEAGLEGAPKVAPAPMNLFMDVRVGGEGGLVFGRPGGREGSRVCFEAVVDVVVVLSACPMDLRASEEWMPVPREVQYEVLDHE